MLQKEHADQVAYSVLFSLIILLLSPGLLPQQAQRAAEEDAAQREERGERAGAVRDRRSLLEIRVRVSDLF